MFEIEMFEEEKHYEMLLSWWRKQNWPDVQLNILPKLGVVVKNKETGNYVYGMWVYYTGSPIVWLEYIVGNPFVKPQEKRGAMEFGIDSICGLAKEIYGNHVGVVFTTSNNQALINSLIKSDFSIGDLNMTQLIKNI